MDPKLFDRLVDSMTELNQPVAMDPAYAQLLQKMRKYVRNRNVVIITARALVRSENTDCANIMSRIGELRNVSVERPDDFGIVFRQTTANDRPVLWAIRKGKTRPAGGFVWAIHSGL